MGLFILPARKPTLRLQPRRAVFRGAGAESDVRPPDTLPEVVWMLP